MKYTTKIIKKNFKECVKKLSSQREMFVKNPSKNFVRQRKLTFENVVNAILSMSSKALRVELMQYFNLRKDAPSVSAFVQQRNKIKYEAFEHLFKNFTESINEQVLYKGYRLLAVDGSDIHVPTNDKEKDAFYIGANNQKSYNLIHLNALYDLQRKIYVDVINQGRHKENEPHALATMVDRDTSTVPTIYIADRGYEAYNVLAHIQEKNQKFLIRVKDFSYGGILYSLNIPIGDELDFDVTLHLTRKKSLEDKTKFIKFLSNKCVFDYLPVSCAKSSSVPTYDIKFRVVRIKLSEDSYETFITNLDREVFGSDEIKNLYSMRWGIETSFRSFKHTLGTLFFHSKKTEYILQEIFAKLVIYNFAQMISSHVIIKQKNRKYHYQVNFAATVYICKNFLFKNISPSLLEALVCQHVLPIREGVSKIRKLTGRKPTPSFLYRIS